MRVKANTRTVGMKKLRWYGHVQRMSHDFIKKNKRMNRSPFLQVGRGNGNGKEMKGNRKKCS